MSNITAYGKEAREEIKSGVSMLAKIVGSTLGAAGRCVIIDNVISQPFVTADGVTVAQNLEIDATLPSLGVQLVKNVAINTNNIAGDGTSSSVVLANAMLCNDFMVEGKSPSFVTRGMERAVTNINKWLDNKARKIKNEKELVNIATISARGDKEMGELIAKAYTHIGKEGQILVEEGRKDKSEVEYISGYALEAGYYHDAFCNNQKRKIVEYNDPIVLVTDFMFYEIKNLVKVMEYAVEKKKPLVVIGGDITEAVLRIAVQNTVQGTLSMTYIQAPDVGIRQSALLKDLAFYTGGKYLSQHLGDKPEDIGESILGTCEKFASYQESTVFINGRTPSKDVDNYRENLTKETEDDDFHDKRKSRLSGRLCKLLVGATTSVEMREKRDRVEDAVNATKAAIEQGYVAGGGVALLTAAKELSDSSFIKSEDERAGYDLVVNSIIAPAKQILQNLFGDATEKADEILRELISKKYPMGYDVKTQKFVNMYTFGIIDPVKVTKTALQSSASVAATILNTNGVIAIIGDKGKLSLD